MPLNINIDSIEDSSNDFSPIPDGRYCAVVVSAVDESKTSQAGAEYDCVNVQFKLVKDFANRRVFKRYIYSHSTSEKASDIGQQGLKQLYVAQGGSGNMTCADLESDTCVEIVLKTKPGNNGYGPRQEVTFVGKCTKDCGDCSGGSCPAPSPSSDCDIF